MLQNLGIVSYCGVSLSDSKGTPIGVMWVIDSKPFDQADRVGKMLRYLAARVSAEVEIFMQLDELRTQCEVLEKQLAEKQAELRTLRAN